MRARLILGLATGLVAVGAAAVTLTGGEEPYRLRLALENAGGLRAGSEVRIGDVKAGEVSSVELGPDDAVVAELELDTEQRPVGKDASLAIAALNLLGQKYVSLDKGDPTTPAPSGYTIPTAQIGTSTDLDQVLDVLDPDTRARLAILINEAGVAMTGRRDDVNALLAELPRTAVSGTRLLEQFISDNRTLAHLVGRSDKFVARIARERRSLSRMVDAAGQTAATFAQRRERLRETLTRAPGTLRTLQGFLADLRATTRPLGPAARNISATAPGLQATLAEVEPFQRAAEPALVQARKVAPSLTRLAEGSTPVLRRTAPTLSSLADLGQALVPVTDTLDNSMDNAVAVLHNWSRAIQFRDELSHVFNAQLVVTPDTLQSMVRRLARSRREDRTTPRRERRDAPGRPKPKAPSTPERPESTAPFNPQSKPRFPDLSPLPDFLGETPVPGLPPGTRPGGPSEPPSGSPDQLLDYLLGP